MRGDHLLVSALLILGIVIFHAREDLDSKFVSWTSQKVFKNEEIEIDVADFEFEENEEDVADFEFEENEEDVADVEFEETEEDVANFEFEENEEVVIDVADCEFEDCGVTFCSSREDVARSGFKFSVVSREDVARSGSKFSVVSREDAARSGFQFAVVSGSSFLLGHLVSKTFGVVVFMIGVYFSCQWIKKHTKISKRRGRLMGNKTPPIELHPVLESKLKDGQIGKLTLDKVIVEESDGTVVFEGLCNDGFRVLRTCFIRRRPGEVPDIPCIDKHPNIVDIYGMEKDGEFSYLAVECYCCSLYDLVTQGISGDEEQCPVQSGGCPSPILLDLMRDVVKGIAFLHRVNILHGKLQVKNILVKKEYVWRAKVLMVEIMDESSSKNAAHSESPAFAVDLINLGILLFFGITEGRCPFHGEMNELCMTGGQCPLGDEINELDIDKEVDWSLIKDMPEATDLIYSLLQPIPDRRPTAIEALNHPVFWSSEMRLSFLCEVSNHLQMAKRKSPQIVNALESGANNIFGGTWNNMVDRVLLTHAKYNYHQVCDLIRLIRNNFVILENFPTLLRYFLAQYQMAFTVTFHHGFPIF